MKIILRWRWMAILLAFAPAAASRAQLPAPPDSVVQVAAEMCGLSPIPLEQIGSLGLGTYWTVYPGSRLNPFVIAPMPCPPLLSQRIYALGNNTFLVDSTGGEQAAATPGIALNSLSRAQAVSLVRTEANAVASLIAQVQAAQSNAASADTSAMTSLGA